MAFKTPSGSFVHAAEYASLLLQVSEHLFPQEKLFDLSADQRRIADSETRNLLLQARWVVDSQAFAEQFAVAQAPPQATAPSDLTLGDKPAAQQPGQYS